MKRTVQLKWLVCPILALALCAAVVLYEKGNAQWAFARMACDGCFVAGVLFTGVGVLAWVASVSGFAAIGYAWYLLTRKLSPSRSKFEQRLSYLEYIEEHRKKDKSPNCILATGAAFLALSFVFLWFS